MKEKEENRLSLLKVEENKLYEMVRATGYIEAFIEWVNDSKKVSEKKREKIYDQIIEEAVAYSVRNSRPKDYWRNKYIKCY